MLTTLKKLWNDERGFVNSMELILISTLAVLGLIVGLVAMRDAVVQELGDSALAVDELNQSYAIAIRSNDITDPTMGPVVDGPSGVGFVTIERDFTDTNNQVFVRSWARFNNYRYNDRTDLGSGPDAVNGLPASIVSIGGTIDEGETLVITP